MPVQTAPATRILVYNVKGFKAGAGTIAAVVREFEPDIALITECGTRRRLRKFAKRLGMKASHASLFPFRRVPRNAVLVRPPLRVTRHRMHRFGDAKRLHPRGAFVAEIERGDDRHLTAMCVHLGLLPQERKRHAQELLELVKPIAGPLLIGGDFNDGPQGKAPAMIARNLWDVWLRVGESTGETFPSGGPEARIDYLFVSDDIRPLKAFVPVGEKFARASDHLPLIAEIKI